MARQPRPVGLDFVQSAPVRLVSARVVSAPAEAVFRAPAEDVAGWPEWFSAVRPARPTEGGAGRRIRFKGGTRFQETVIATEPAEVYTYRVDETNAPGVRALVEERRLTPHGTGTRVQWTWAADGTAAFRFAVRPQSGHTPVASSESMAFAYGAMSSPCAASHSSE